MAQKATDATDAQDVDAEHSNPDPSWPTFEYSGDDEITRDPRLQPEPGVYAVPDDGSRSDMIDAIKYVSTAEEAAEAIVTDEPDHSIAMSIVQGDLPRVGDLPDGQDPDDDTADALMSDVTPTEAAETGPDTDETAPAGDGDAGGEDPAGDVNERIQELGDTHWEIGVALSNATDGLTIRELVKDHVATKKPWTQRCARDLCNANLVEREKDGRAYVYRMKPLGPSDAE